MSAKTLLFVFAGLSLLIVAGLLINPKDQASAPNEIDVPAKEQSAIVRDVESKLEQKKATLIDVRTQQEFSEEHARGAIHHDVELIKAGSFPQVDKESEIYVYCRSGNRSAQAKSLLETAGFSNVNDLGALSDWVSQGGSVE